MTALIKWIATAAFAFALVYFILLNMNNVPVTFSPGRDALELPLAVLILAAFAGGVLFGGAFVWMEHGPVGRGAAKRREKMQTLKRDLETEKQKQAEPGLPAVR